MVECKLKILKPSKSAGLDRLQVQVSIFKRLLIVYLAYSSSPEIETVQQQWESPQADIAFSAKTQTDSDYKR